MQRGDVPPAILQSDIFHTLTSQYGYRTMSYFDSRQIYRHSPLFPSMILGSKDAPISKHMFTARVTFCSPKDGRAHLLLQKYGRLPKLEEAPPPYLEIASTGALSSKGLIHGVVISQHCHSKPLLTNNASKTRNRIVTLCLENTEN